VAELKRRYRNLLTVLGSYPSPVAAVSGGVDSALLLAAAKEARPETVTAVTVVTPYVPEIEVRRAKEIAAFCKVPHRIIEIETIPVKIGDNPFDRCYHCKQILFTEILREAEKINGTVLDGSNADDMKSRRPGIQALRELGVQSPLAESGLSKKDIRSLSRQLSLPSADIPSCSCLLTRFPCNTRIEEDLLRKVESAEVYLRDRGLRQVRVRVHGEIARVEVGREERERFFQTRFLDETHDGLSAFGFRYVTLDLYGFKSGSMDIVEGADEK
jgi:pyridinium-3,5-biscarboxylic acid mononucleotide sulfurtransferase